MFLQKKRRECHVTDEETPRYRRAEATLQTQRCHVTGQKDETVQTKQCHVTDEKKPRDQGREQDSEPSPSRQHRQGQAEPSRFSSQASRFSYEYSTCEEVRHEEARRQLTLQIADQLAVPLQIAPK
eukprot:1168875-Rhodomonas_salina.4